MADESNGGAALPESGIAIVFPGAGRTEPVMDYRGVTPQQIILAGHLLVRQGLRYLDEQDKAEAARKSRIVKP